MNFVKRTFIWFFCIVLGALGFVFPIFNYLYEYASKGNKLTADITGYLSIVKLWFESYAGPMIAVLQILVLVTAAGLLLVGLVGILKEFTASPIPEIKKGGVILAISYTLLNVVLMVFMFVLRALTRENVYYFELGFMIYVAIAVGAIITILMLILIQVLGDTSVWTRRARAVPTTTAFAPTALPTAFGHAPTPMMVTPSGQTQAMSYGQMPQAMSYGQMPQTQQMQEQAPPPISYSMPGPLPQTNPASATTHVHVTHNAAAQPTPTPVMVVTQSAAPSLALSAPSTPALAPAPDKKKDKPVKEKYVDSTVTFRFIEGMNDKQIRAAVEDLFVRANRGEADAQFRLGICYQNGTGVPQNNYTAADWQQKASAQGHMQAKFVLGEYYIEGNGVPQKIVEGITLIKESARKGFVGAQMRLATFYQNGQYLPRDYEKAVQWFTKAAEQGNNFSINALKQFERNAEGKWQLRTN